MSLDDPMTSDDGDSCSSHSEQILAMARFHRILLESFEKRIKKQRKEERRIQKEQKREKKMKRDEEKMQRQAKRDKSKAKAKAKKAKTNEKKEKDSEKKTKKKKEKLKSPKKKKKTKTITVEGSNDDGGGKFDAWWSIGIDEDIIEEDEDNSNNNKKKKKNKTKTKKTTRMVNKIPKTKKKRKPKAINMEGSFISLSEHDHTETTASLGSSHHWSVVTQVVRKTTDDSAEDTTSDSPYWWDLPPLPSTLTPKEIPLPETPKPNANYLPMLLSPCFGSEMGASTPPAATSKLKMKKYLPLLLSPRNYDDSSDDSEDVSMCSEESMSEQMLDDLSCILDCEHDEDECACDCDCVSEPSPVKKEKSLRAHLDRILDCSDEDEDCVSELSHIKKERISSAHADCGSSLNSHKKESDRWSVISSDHDSSSICSAPSVPMRLSPMRKADSFVVRTDDSKLKKHLGGIKILASRENNTNDHDADVDIAAGTNPSPNLPNLPTVSPQTRTQEEKQQQRMFTPNGTRLQIDGSFAAVGPLEVAVDGIVMVRRPGLFPKRNI
jgi:hypothetical protein